MYSTHPGEHVEQLRKEMDILASTLPEYTTVMGIYGVGKTYGPQLIAEIGNVSRFTHRGALTAFAGVDPGVDQSGQHNSKSNRASKVGSARLSLFRKPLTPILNPFCSPHPICWFFFWIIIISKLKSTTYTYFIRTLTLFIIRWFS